MRLFRRDLDGMHALYLNGMMRSMVFALIGIFTPVFVYLEMVKGGYASWQAVAGVAAFYLITRLVVLLTAIPASHYIEKVGFRRSILVSAVFLAAYLFTLKMAPGNLWLLLLAPVLGGLNIPTYWIARGSIISQDGNKREVGSQMGRLLVVEQVSAMTGPLLAGLIIEKWGFPQLYSLAAVVLMLSVVPLWYMPGHSHRNGASWKGFGDWIRNRRYFHQAVGVASRAVDDYAIAIIWPLAIYLMGWHVSSVGGLFSAVSVISILVRYILSKWFDVWLKRRDWSDELVFGAAQVGTSVIWTVRVFITSVRAVLTVDLLGAVFGALYGGMYLDYVQLGGMRMGSIAYWVYTEMIYSIATIFVASAMMVGAWFGIWKELVLAMASLWALLGMVQARESNMR
ncbi:MAG: MFS transporter [bacterium]